MGLPGTPPGAATPWPIPTPTPIIPASMRCTHFGYFRLVVRGANAVLFMPTLRSSCAPVFKGQTYVVLLRSLPVT